jgi:hypothetical protein
MHDGADIDAQLRLIAVVRLGDLQVRRDRKQVVDYAGALRETARKLRLRAHIRDRERSRDEGFCTSSGHCRRPPDHSADWITPEPAVNPTTHSVTV